MNERTKVKDHFLTQEVFNLKKNTFGFLETLPKPNPEQSKRYYQTENYISHTDAKKSFFDFIYQNIKKQNNRSKKSLIKKYKKTGSLLDYGCGTGDFLKELKDDFNIIGIEPNIKAAEIAQQKSGVQIITNTDLSYFKSDLFDFITLWHVFEHIYDLKKTSIELKRILNRKGILIIAVPNYKSYDAKHYKEYWAAYDVPRHLWHFSKSSMRKWWKEFDMEIKEIIPMKWDAFYVSILSEKYQDKNIFNFIKGIYYGFISNRKAKKSGEYSSLIYVLSKKEYFC